MSKTSKLLLKHYLIWCDQIGAIKPQREFAETVIGMSDKQFSHYFSGKRQPSDDTARLFALKLNDLEFLDAVDLPRSDPGLYYVQRNWDKAPPEVQKRIADIFKEYDDGHKKGEK